MEKETVRVAAAILYNQKNEILITQRLPGAHLGGLWEFPGGSIEKGESGKQALVREIKEETNLDIRVGRLFWRKTFEYDIKIIDISFHNCFLKDEKQTIFPFGVADFRWVKSAELTQFDFPPADEALLGLLQE